jgi:ADP-heptose:LPS heptosyltransferase
MRIAVVLRGRIGDLMCTWPVLSWLKAKNPHSRIHLFGEPIHRELVELVPPVDRLWVLPMSHTQYTAGWRYGMQWRGQYDMAIAAHTRPRSWVAWFMRAMNAPHQVAFVDRRRRFSHIHQSRLWKAEYEEAHHETLKLFQLLDPSLEQVPAGFEPRFTIPERLRERWDEWLKEALAFGGDAPLVTVSVSSNRDSCRLNLEGWRRCLSSAALRAIAASEQTNQHPFAASADSTARGQPGRGDGRRGSGPSGRRPRPAAAGALWPHLAHSMGATFGQNPHPKPS